MSAINQVLLSIGTRLAEFEWNASPLYGYLANTTVVTALHGAGNGTYIYSSAGTQYTAPGSRNWTGLATSGTGGVIIATDDSYGRLWLSTNSGSTWSALTPASTTLFNSISMSVDGAVMALTQPGSAYIITSSDTGSTWTQQTGAGQRNWVRVVTSPDGSTMLASAGTSLFTSTDSGVTWTERTGAGSRAWGTALAISSDGTYMAAGVGTGGGDIYTSSDSGVTWTERSGAGSKVWNDIALSRNTSGEPAFMVAAANSSYLQVSNSFGSSWTAQIAASSQNWKKVSSTGYDDRFVAVGFSKPYINY